MCRVSHTHRGSDQSDQGWSFNTGCQHRNCHHASVRLSSPANRGPPLKHISHLMLGRRGGGVWIYAVFFLLFPVVPQWNISQLTTEKKYQCAKLLNRSDMTLHGGGETHCSCFVIHADMFCSLNMMHSCINRQNCSWGKGRVQRCSHLKTCFVLQIEKRKPKKIKIGTFWFRMSLWKKRSCFKAVCNQIDVCDLLALFKAKYQKSYWMWLSITFCNPSLLIIIHEPCFLILV